MKIVIVVCLIVLCTFPVHASILINEISPRGDEEWVELYNPDEIAYDLAGWSLEDDDGAPADIALAGAIEPKGFAVFSHGKGWLADGGDTVSLVASSSGVVDTYTYESSSDGKTIARLVDGGGWDAASAPSKGAANPLPPTPSPSVLPSPSPSVSSPSPSPARSPTPAPSVASLTPSPSPLRSPPASPQPVVDEVRAGTVAGQTDIDLSAFGGVSLSPIPTTTPMVAESLRLNTDRVKVVICIGLGLGTIGGAGATYLRKKSKSTSSTV